MTRIAILIVVASQVMIETCSAQGFVEHIEPPVLERGKTTRVLVVGSGLGKSIGLWTSLPADAVKTVTVGDQTSTKATLDVTVAAVAPVGVFGVRLATEDGLANACLLLIDDLPVKKTPALRPLTGLGSPVKLPVALWGRFREATVDRFAIEVTKGQTVTFEAVANRLGKDVDPLVTIRNARGKIVAERDNDPGLYFDCRFTHTFAEAGTYTVEMRDARFHGHEHGYYVLRMGKFPGARVALPTAIQWSKRFAFHLPGTEPVVPDRPLTDQEARFQFAFPPNAAGLFLAGVKRKGDDGSAWLPIEATDVDVVTHQSPGNARNNATPAKVPAALCGILSKPGERHYYRLTLTKGQRINVRAEARAFNSPADLEIEITDAKGKELRRAGENAKEEIALDFTAAAPGVYGLTVRDVNRDGGPDFGYRLDVRPASPSIQVTADVEGLTVPRGDYQPVPLTIIRSDYAGKIALSLVGAPPGVTLTPNEVEGGANTIVCKLRANADAALGLHTLQILARPAEIDDARPTIVRTQPLIDRQIVNVDLIPHALREDQRRLPPSLTDRFALQITKPSFFTFELPEKLVTLARYQHAEFPIQIETGDVANPKITFSAKGGQIAAKEEGRTRVFAEFAKDKGSIHSRILTNLAKHRVDITAVAIRDGRSISLTRTFELDIRPAFSLTTEPALLKMNAGDAGGVMLAVERMTSFEGDITVQIAPTPGFEMPATVVIPRGKQSVTVPIKTEASRPIGRVSIQLNATAEVNGFEEEQRGRIEIEILKAEQKK